VIAIINTGVKHFVPQFNLYPYKLDDILEKNTKRKDGGTFAGWVLGVYLNDFLIYENNGLKNMVQINKIENYQLFFNNLFEISIERFKQIENVSFTNSYYSTYRNHNLE
jgi:hypothetical protein